MPIDFNSDRWEHICKTSKLWWEGKLKRPLIHMTAATHVRFIDLNRAMEPLAVWPDQGAPQLVQPGPSRLVAAQTEYTLKTKRVGTVLLARHEPYRLKPSS